MWDKGTPKSNNKNFTPAEGYAENTTSQCTKTNDIAQNASLESDTLVVATYVDNVDGDCGPNSATVDSSSVGQNEPSDINHLLTIVRLCDSPSASTQRPSNELTETKTSTCVSNVAANITNVQPTVQSMSGTAPTIKETNPSDLTVAINCDELQFASTGTNSKISSSQQFFKPTISVKYFSPILRDQTCPSETLPSSNVTAVTEPRNKNSESDNVVGPLIQISNNNQISLPAISDLDRATREATTEVSIEDITLTSETRVSSPANSSVTSVSTPRAARSTNGRRVVCMRHMRRPPKEPEEYMDALFPYIREVHNQIRKALLHSPLTDVKDNALLKRKMFDAIRRYVSGCKNEFEQVGQSLMLCRRLKRNIIRLLDLFHEICSSSREDPIYMYHISQLIAVYNSLEIRLSFNLTRLQKCALIHRLAHIINKHLLVKDESLAKENVLRMFLHMPDMYSARFIMEPLFNTFLEEIHTNSSTWCQRELADKTFVQYIIVLHQWKEMLRDPLEQVELINRAQHFMCPTKTLHTNPMYANHLPTIHTRQHAVKDILNSLKYFHDLKNAAICDDTLQGGDGDIEVVIDEVINTTPLWDFGATYAAECKHQKLVNRRVVMPEPLECVDLTLEDEEPSRMEHVENPLDWLTDLKEKAAERVQTDATEKVICLDSDSDGELFSGSILDPTESYQDCDAVDTDYTSLDGSTTDDKAALEDDTLPASGITSNGLRTYLAPKSKNQYNSTREVYLDGASESESEGEGGNVTRGTKPSKISASLPRIVNTFTVSGKQNMHLLNSPRYSLDIGPERFGNEDLDNGNDDEFQSVPSTSSLTMNLGKVIYSQAVPSCNRRFSTEDNANESSNNRREFKGKSFETQDNQRYIECGALRMNAEEKPVKKQVKFNDNPIGPTRRPNTKLPIKPAIHLSKTQSKNQQSTFSSSPQPRFISPSSSTSSTTESLKQMAQKGRRIVDSFKVQILPKSSSAIIIDSDDDNDNFEVSASANTTINKLTVSTQPIQSKKAHENAISNQYLSVLKSNICKNPKCKMKTRYVSHRSKSIHGPKDISSTNYICNSNVEFIHISDDNDDDNDSFVCNKVKRFKVDKGVELEEQNSNVSTTTGPSLESNTADERKKAVNTEKCNKKQMLIMIECTSSQVYRAPFLENNVSSDICTSSTETLLQETESDHSVSSPNIVDLQCNLANETCLQQMSLVSELDWVKAKGDDVEPLLSAKKNDKTEVDHMKTSLRKHTVGGARENERNGLKDFVCDKNTLNKTKSELACDFNVHVKCKQTSTSVEALREEVKTNTNVKENYSNTDEYIANTSEGGVEQVNGLDCEALVLVCPEQARSVDIQNEQNNAHVQAHLLTESNNFMEKSFKVQSLKTTNQPSEESGKTLNIEKSIQNDCVNAEQPSSTPVLECTHKVLESKTVTKCEDKEKVFRNSVSSATNQIEPGANEKSTKSQIFSSTSATSDSTISATPSHIQAASDKIEVQINKYSEKSVDTSLILTEIVKIPSEIHKLSAVSTDDISAIFESVNNTEELNLVDLDVNINKQYSNKKQVTQENEYVPVNQETNNVTDRKTGDTNANIENFESNIIENIKTLDKDTKGVDIKQLPFPDKILNTERNFATAQTKITGVKKDANEKQIESSASQETSDNLTIPANKQPNIAEIERTPVDREATHKTDLNENYANSTKTLSVESVTLDEEVIRLTNFTTSTEDLSVTIFKGANMETNEVTDVLNQRSVSKSVKANLNDYRTYLLPTTEPNNSMAYVELNSENANTPDNNESKLSEGLSMPTIIPVISEEEPKTNEHVETSLSNVVKSSSDGLVRLVAAVNAVEALNFTSNQLTLASENRDLEIADSNDTILISCENSSPKVNHSFHELAVEATTGNTVDIDPASFVKNEKPAIEKALNCAVNSIKKNVIQQVSITVLQNESIATKNESDLTGILICGDKSPKTNLERLAEAVLLTEAAAQKYSGVVTERRVMQTGNDYNQSNAKVHTVEKFKAPKYECLVADNERCNEENGLSNVSCNEAKRINNDSLFENKMQEKSIVSNDERLDRITPINYNMYLFDAGNCLATKGAQNDAGVSSMEVVSKTLEALETNKVLIKQEQIQKPPNESVTVDTENLDSISSKKTAAPYNPPLPHKPNPTFHSSFEKFINSLKTETELKLPRKSPRITSKTQKVTDEMSNSLHKSKKMIVLNMASTSDRLAPKNAVPSTPQSTKLSAISDSRLSSIRRDDYEPKQRYSLRRTEQWKVVKNTSVSAPSSTKGTDCIYNKKAMTRSLPKRCIKIRLARAKIPTKAERKTVPSMPDEAVQNLELQFGDVSHRPITRKLAAALNSSLQMETENVVIEPIKPFPSRSRKSGSKQEIPDNRSPSKRKRCESITKSWSKKGVVESKITGTDTAVEAQRKRKDYDVEATHEIGAPKSDERKQIPDDAVLAELAEVRKFIFDDTINIPEKSSAKRTKVENAEETASTRKTLATQSPAQIMSTFKAIFIKPNSSDVEDMAFKRTESKLSEEKPIEEMVSAININEEVLQRKGDKLLVQTSDKWSIENIVQHESQENGNKEPTDENIKTSAMMVMGLETQGMGIGEACVQSSAKKSFGEMESQAQQNFKELTVDSSNERVIVTPPKDVLLAESVQAISVNCHEQSNSLTESNKMTQLADISSFRSLTLELTETYNSTNSTAKNNSKSDGKDFQRFSEVPNEDSTVDLSISNLNQINAKNEDLNNTDYINILKANMEADKLLEEYNHSARIITNTNIKIPLAAQTPSERRTPACSSVTFSYTATDTSSSSTSSCSCKTTSTLTSAADLCKNEPTSFKVVQSQAQVVELLSNTSASFQDLSLLDLEHDVIISNDDLLSELMPTAIMDTMAATSLEHNYAIKPLESVMRTEYDAQYDLQIKSESPMLQGEDENNWRDVEVFDINNAKDISGRHRDNAHPENTLEDKSGFVDGINERPLQATSLRVSIPIVYIKRLEELLGKQKESREMWYLSEKPSTSKAALEELVRKNALLKTCRMANSKELTDIAMIDSSAPRQLLCRECCQSPSLPLKKRRNVSGMLEEDLFNAAALLSEEDNLVQSTSESIISVTENITSELDGIIDTSELDLCENMKYNKDRGKKPVLDDLSYQKQKIEKPTTSKIEDSKEGKDGSGVLQDYQCDGNGGQVAQSRQTNDMETENTEDKGNIQIISSQDEIVTPTKRSNIVEGNNKQVEREKENREGDRGKSVCGHDEEESKPQQSRLGQCENGKLLQGSSEKMTAKDLVEEHEERVGLKPPHKDLQTESQNKNIQQLCAEHSGVHSLQKECVGTNSTDFQNLTSIPNLAKSEFEATSVKVAGDKDSNTLSGAQNAKLVTTCPHSKSTEVNESTNQKLMEAAEIKISYEVVDPVNRGYALNQEGYSKLAAKNFATDITDTAKKISSMELKSNPIQAIIATQQIPVKETRLTNYEDHANEVVLTSYDDNFFVTASLSDSGNDVKQLEEANHSVFSTKEFAENDFDTGNDIISTQEIEESAEIKSIKSSPKSSPMNLTKLGPSFTTDSSINTDFSRANELIDFMPILTNTITSTHSDDMQLFTIASNQSFLNSNITSMPPTTQQMELFTSSAGITSTTPHTSVITTALNFNNIPIFTATELGIEQDGSARSDIAALTQMNELGFGLQETMQSAQLAPSAIQMDSTFAQSQSQFMVADNWKTSTSDVVNTPSTLKISLHTSETAKHPQTLEVKAEADVSSGLITTTPTIKICSTKQSKPPTKNGGRKPIVKTNTVPTISTNSTEIQNMTQLSSLSPILPLIKPTTTTTGQTTNIDTAPVFSFPDVESEVVSDSHVAVAHSEPTVTCNIRSHTPSSNTVRSTTSSLSAQISAEKKSLIAAAPKSKSQSLSQSAARSGTRTRAPARVQVVTPQPKNQAVAQQSVEEDKTLQPVFTSNTAAFCSTDFSINRMVAALPASYPTTPVRSVTRYANLFHFEKYIQQLMALIDVPAIIESAHNLFVDKQALAEAHAALLAQATQFDDEGNALSQPLLLKYHKDGTISILNDNDECIILTASVSKMVKRLSLALSILQEQQSPVLGIRARIHALLKQLTQTATTKIATHISTTSVVGPSVIPTAVVNPTNLVENARNIELSILNAVKQYSGDGEESAKQLTPEQVNTNDTNAQIYTNWHAVEASDGQLMGIASTELQIENDAQFINIDPLPLLADEGTTGYEHAVAFDFDDNPTILSSNESISAQRFENAFEETLVGGMDGEKSFNWIESEHSRPMQQWQQQHRGNVERRWQEHSTTFAYEDAVVRGEECVGANNTDVVHAMLINSLGANSTTASSSASRIEGVSVADSIVQSGSASVCGPQRRETIKKTGFQKIETDQEQPTTNCSKKVSGRKTEKAPKIQANLSSTAAPKQSKMRSNSKQSNAASQLKISAIHYRYMPPHTIANAPCKQSATLHYRPTAPQQRSHQQSLRNADFKMAPQYVTNTSNHSKQPALFKTIDSIANLQLYSQQNPQNSALAGGLQHSNNVRFILANPLQQPNVHKSQRFVSVPNIPAPLNSSNTPTQDFPPLQEVHIQYPYQLQQAQPNFSDNQIQTAELQLHSIKGIPQVSANLDSSKPTDMTKANATAMTTPLPKPTDATILRMVRTNRSAVASRGKTESKCNLTQNFQTQTPAFPNDTVEAGRGLPNAAQPVASPLEQIPQHLLSQPHQQQVQFMQPINTGSLINDVQQTEMDQLRQHLIKQETQRQTELQFQIIQQQPQVLLRGVDENPRMHTMMTIPNALTLYQPPARQDDVNITHSQQHPPQQQQHVTQEQLIEVSKQSPTTSVHSHRSQNAAGNTTSFAIANTAMTIAPTKQTNPTRKRGRPRKYDDEMLLANSELLRKRSARDMPEKFPKANNGVKIIPITATNSNATITTTNQTNPVNSQLITAMPTTYYTLTHNSHELEQKQQPQAQQIHQPNSISLSTLATNLPIHQQLGQQPLRPSFTSQSSANAFSLIENMISGVEAAGAGASGNGHQQSAKQQSHSKKLPHMPPSLASNQHAQHHV